MRIVTRRTSSLVLALVLVAACGHAPHRRDAPAVSASRAPDVLAIAPARPTRADDPMAVVQGERVLGAAESDALRTFMYDGALVAAREPSLFTRKRAGLEAYRVVWRRMNFVVVVRVVRTAGGFFVTGTDVELAQHEHEGYEPPREETSEDEAREARVTAQIRGFAPDAQVAPLLTIVDHDGLWSLPSLGPNVGFDGSWWLVELTRDGEYHVIERRVGHDVARFGMAMVRLAGLPRVEPVY